MNRNRSIPLAGVPALAFLVLVIPLPLGAHPGIPQQIEEVSAAIRGAPRDVDLRLRRASLYRQRRMWTEALEDLRAARRLAMGRPEIDRLLGEVLIDSGDPAKGVNRLNRYLGAVPEDASALVVRARASAKLGRFEAAAEDLARAIDAVVPPARPRPELYLEQARALAALGDERGERALAVLEEGISRLGPLIVLQVEAVDLEMRLGKRDAAILRLERIASRSGRREAWDLRRAEVLEGAGRIDEARAAYLLARGAIVKLPPARRSTAQVIAIERRIEAGIERTETNGRAGESR